MKNTRAVLGLSLLLLANPATPLPTNKSGVMVSAPPLSQSALNNGNPDVLISIKKRIHANLPKHWKASAAKITLGLWKASRLYDLDPIFLMAVVERESAFDPLARGQNGEIGLMQIKPTTALWLHQEHKVKGLPESLRLRSSEGMIRALEVPSLNLLFGAAYLHHLRNRFNGHGSLFVSAYNHGAARLESRLRKGDRPSGYRDRVLKSYVSLARELRSAKASQLAYYAAARE